MRDENRVKGIRNVALEEQIGSINWCCQNRRLEKGTLEQKLEAVRCETWDIPGVDSLGRGDSRCEAPRPACLAHQPWPRGHVGRAEGTEARGKWSIGRDSSRGERGLV